MNGAPDKPVYERRISLVVGQTGTGKSQYTKRLIKKSKRVIIIDPQDEYRTVPAYDNLDEMKRAIEQNRLIFRVRHTDLRDFNDICYLFPQLPETLLVVEEAQRIIPPHGKLPEFFEELIYRGRHCGASIHLIAQRPTTVDIAIRSQFNTLVTFRQTEKSDIQWIADVTGFNVENEIRHLKRFEYLIFDEDGCRQETLKGIVK